MTPVPRPPHGGTAAFLRSAGRGPSSGSSSWGSGYALTLQRVAKDYAARAPRSLQRHLGPSELGAPCDRQIVGKLVGEPPTNHVTDPWPSIVGTAVHAWLADAFTWHNGQLSVPRWLAEHAVTPLDGHRGTADLYDAEEQAVVDHKILGKSAHEKLQYGGPSIRYRVQLLLYAHGYRRLGLPVRRVALAAWPRTGSSLSGLYVWDEMITPATDVLLAQVAEDTERRKALAAQVAAGTLLLTDISTAPEDTECYFCPFYRPQARDGGPGCPGTIEH